MKKEYTVQVWVYEYNYFCYKILSYRKAWVADVRAKRKEGFAWLQIKHCRRRFECKEEAKEWANQVKADWVRNNFFALRKY